jgi:uncharacterized membrane protein
MPSGADPVQHGTDALPATLEPAVSESESPVSQSPPDAPEPGPPGAQPEPGRKHRLGGAYRDPFVGATSLAVLGAYFAIPLFRLRQLNPSSWDLAIYTEYVKQAASFHAPVADIRTAGFNLLGDHFQPVVMVIAPFFRVIPSAGTLVTAQALLAALSVFAVGQAARETFGPGPSRAIAVAYGFSWGLQQMANFDFHEVAFAVPLLAFSLSALVRGRLRATVWWALPLVFVKEDQGFTVAAIGLYLTLAGMRAAREPDTLTDPAAREDAEAQAGFPDADERTGDLDISGPTADLDALPQPAEPDTAANPGRAPAIADPDGSRRIKAGQFLLIWGFAWSFLAIGVIIPHFNPAHQYDYWSDGGILAPGGHPTVTGLIGQLFHAWPDKLQTIAMLLLPTAFIALRSPLVLVAVPSLVLRFLSTNSAFWGTYWHYNTTVIPVIFIAAIDAMARIGAAMTADGPARAEGWASGSQGARRAVLAGARRYGAAMMLAITVPLAFQFPLSTVWNAQSYRIGSHVRSADAAMAEVPDGATVQATLDLLAPLAARTDAFWIGNRGNPRTQYIVFDSQDSGSNPPVSNVPAFVAQFYPGHAYAEIFRSGDVYVFRRTT